MGFFPLVASLLGVRMTKNMENCVFCKIIKREIPTEIVFEDENVIVFPDVHPSAPVHLLLVSKKHIEDFSQSEPGLWVQVLSLAKKFIEEKKLVGKGYRILVNGGGAAMVSHLHFHLLGEISTQRGV